MTEEVACQTPGKGNCHKIELTYQRTKTVLENGGYSCLLKKKSDRELVTDIMEREKRVAEFMVTEDGDPETPGVPRTSVLFYNPMRPQDYRLNDELQRTVTDVYIDELAEHIDRLNKMTGII